MYSHFTSCNFLSLAAPTQRKSCWIFSISQRTLAGAASAEKIKIGMD